MDPVTILGIAAATAQFIDFGLKTVVLCKQIRDSATGSTEHQSDLQLSIKRLNAIKKVVDVKQCPAGTSRVLKQTVQDCSSVAGELEALLLDIQAIAKKKPLGALRAALRSLKDQKKIEKLQNKLEKCQDRFHASVSMDTREKVLELLAQQGKASDTIEHFLVPKLQSMHLDSSKAHKETHSKLATLESRQQASSSKIMQIQEDSRREMHVRFDDAEHLAQSSDLHESFLKNLEYPDMFARKHSIGAPSSDTFDWIFTGELPEGYDFSGRKEHRGKFSRWLQSDQNVFWINGKAGSGKSSLMSYIESDPRTTELLKVWAGDRPLHIFSFFFWRAGSHLQKSIAGMLQCLLHQLAEKKPAVIDSIIQNDPATRYSGAWNEARLLRALPTALSFYQGECVVCLIDGLDEFEGQYRDLLRTLFTMQCTSGMKLCVSSRPEAALETRLSQFQSIRLQDLNYNDIRTFVQNEFFSCGNAFDEKLVNEVIDRAEGIFLWAVLVCKSLMDGHEAKDDAEKLQQRLRSIPSGLQDIIRYMFSNLDEVHHANILLYFHLLKWSSELDLNVSVALITVILHKRPFRSWKDFMDACHDWQDRIVAQCKGLIEISAGNYHARPMWAFRDISTGRIRHRFYEQDILSAEQDYARSHLQWIHRSAYDCIVGDSKDGSIPWMEALDERSLAHETLKAIAWIAQHTPHLFVSRSAYNMLNTPYEKMVDFGGVVTSKAADLNEETYSMLDEIHDTILASLHEGGAPGIWIPAFMEHPEQGSPDGHAHMLDSLAPRDRFRLICNLPLLVFWEALSMNLEDYISSRFERIASNDFAVSLCAGLSPAFWSHQDYTLCRPGRVKMLSLLQQRSEGRKHLTMVIQTITELFRSTKYPVNWLVTWVGNDGLESEIAAWSLMTLLNHAENVRNQEWWSKAYWKAADTWQISAREVMTRERIMSSRALPLQLTLPLRYFAECFGPGPRGNLPPMLRIFAVSADWSDPSGRETYGPTLLVGHEDCRIIACFDLSVQTTEHLLTFSKGKIAEFTFSGTPSDYAQCLEAAVNEIWDNDGAQLDAWQQLYLLTCVKKWFKIFWEVRESVVEEVRPDEDEEEGENLQGGDDSVLSEAKQGVTDVQDAS